MTYTETFPKSAIEQLRRHAICSVRLPRRRARALYGVVFPIHCEV